MPMRVAMLSAHTSPLEQPGSGSAGGMNVYVLETARQMAARGIAVTIIARSSDARCETVELAHGLTVHQVPAGGIAAALLDDPGRFDVVHSHYWVSGQIGLPVREALQVPLVHSMHTMGRVKNLSLAAGDMEEPSGRITAESEIVRLADRLVANTAREREELTDLYAADPSRIDVVHPGVDLDVFRCGRRADARSRLGISVDEELVLFAGRIQPHKAPDVLVEAVRRMRRCPRLVVVGGPSGVGMTLGEAVEVLPPVRHELMADWYAAADLVCVPSFSESFGLVALEAQACGTPVVAARVGGLGTTVVDGVTGILVDGHAPDAFAAAMSQVLDDRAMHAAMSAKAVVHASAFTWHSTTEKLLDSYSQVLR